jgi:hypothetical protein
MEKMTENQLKELCSEWNEMRYATEHPFRRGQASVLANGKYKGLEFLVLNMGGSHPCGYVNIESTKLNGKFYNEIDNIQCHGCLTFSGKNAAILKHGWWIGWDYAHLGDFMPYYTEEEQKRWNCVKYTTADVVQECVNVIEQIQNEETTK